MTVDGQSCDPKIENAVSYRLMLFEVSIVSHISFFDVPSFLSRKHNAIPSLLFRLPCSVVDMNLQMVAISRRFEHNYL